MMNVWQAIVYAMKAEGVEYVFGLPSGDLFYDVLYDHRDIKTVLVREESAGPFMAMGYARISGKPAACYGASGPGVTNMISGVLEAHSACLPVIVVGAGSKRRNAGMGAFQEVDQIALMEPVTKWCERITEPERTFWIMRRAFSLAMNGKPGPVYIEVPRDIGAAEVGPTEYVPAVYPLRTSGDPERIETVVKMMAAAARPLLVAGGGAINSRAFAEVRDLIELFDMPVMTTPCGRGIIPEDHRLALGLVGMYFTEVGRRAYDTTDLLITVGSRNEDFQSGEQTFFPNEAKYIQIDIEPDEIGRNWVPDVAVVGDAALILRDLTARIRARGGKQTGRSWVTDLVKAKDDFRERMRTACRDESTPLKTKRIMAELNDVFGKDTILVNENGSQDLWSYYWGVYRVLDTNACVAPGEQTCMGGGCAAAVGAKLAAPSKKVICPVGDGAFQMFMKELPTTIQHDAPVTYVVLNNSGLGWIKYFQRRRGERFISTEFEVQPDFAETAKANQCYGERVERPDQIRPALERALKANANGQTAVIEFVVDTWEMMPGFVSYYDRVR